MNGLPFVIFANLLAAFALICGLKLFDIGSDFANSIRKSGFFLGVIILAIAIVSFILGDVALLFSDSSPVGPIFLSTVASVVAAFALDCVRELLLDGGRRKTRLAIAGVGLIDVILNVASGIAVGLCFTISSGAGMVTLCAVTVLRLTLYAANAHRYRSAKISRKATIAILAASLLLSTAAAILTFMIARRHYSHLGGLLAVMVGYLISLITYRLSPLVKKQK